MNKNYDFASNQRQRYLLRLRKRLDKEPITSSPSMRNITFSYKGVVIDRKESLYKIRSVKLEGFVDTHVQGVFNSASKLRDAIDYALACVNPDKHTALREKNQNVQCEHCGAAFLLRAGMLSPHLDGQVLNCPCCAHELWEDLLTRLRDDVFY